MASSAVDPRDRKSAHGGMLSRANPAYVVFVLVCFLLVGAATYAWRFLDMMERPPSTYYESQIQRWEEQLVSKPRDPAVWATLGSLYENSGDEAKADNAFTRALDFDRDNASAMVYFAKKKRVSGDVEEARALLTSAASNLPDSGRYLVYFELGEIERASGRDKAAIDAYEKSIADNDTFWNASFHLAALYEKRGELDQALEAALSARRFVEKNEALNQMIVRLKSQGADAEVERRSMYGDGVSE